MQRALIAFALALASCAVAAAPNLMADPYVVAPASVTYTVDGSAPKACTLTQVAGGWQPVCDLAAITAPGTYTLVMTATSNAGCINTLDAADCSGAGSASSAPFAYTWRGSVVSPPTLKVAP